MTNLKDIFIQAITVGAISRDRKFTRLISPYVVISAHKIPDNRLEDDYLDVQVKEFLDWWYSPGPSEKAKWFADITLQISTTQRLGDKNATD